VYQVLEEFPFNLLQMCFFLVCMSIIRMVRLITHIHIKEKPQGPFDNVGRLNMLRLP
jgi:hypothetical protein